MFLLLLIPPLAVAEPRNYLDTIPIFWRELYPEGGEGLYCGSHFAARDRDYNIEHVFPMSWVGRELRCGDRDACRRSSRRFNQIESDMHNMYPARKDINRQRGAFAYREIAGEHWVERSCDLEIDYRKRVVEPRPASRGNIARAMLYMADRYQMPIYERQRQMLLGWHRDDPPDDEERWRNRRIGEIQGNTNSWVESVSPNR
jgi:deoxyribonuclease-1